MSDPTATLSPQDEKALKALIAWWEDAGIELEAPIPRPRPAAPANRTGRMNAAPAAPPVPRGDKTAEFEGRIRQQLLKISEPEKLGTAAIFREIICPKYWE